jgi:hypothetical protein
MMAAQHDAQQVRDCMGRFSKLETTLATTVSIVERIDNEFFNHVNSKGLKTIVLERFAAEDREKELDKKFRDLRDKETKEALLAHEKIIKDALDLKAANVAADLEVEKVKTEKRSLIWQIAGVFVSTAAVCVAILAVVCTLYVSHHSSIEPPDLLRQILVGQTYTAHTIPPPQDATTARTTW